MTSSIGRPLDPRSSTSSRSRYTAAEAFEAREYFVLGWSLDRISRKTQIPRPILYKWCVCGLHHPDAIPPGLAEAMANYDPPKLSSAERIDQLPRSLTRRWRQMYMADTSVLGRIQLELNEMDLPVPISGLESDGWVKSDLVRLLLGSGGGRCRPYPQGHEAVPPGYMRWWKLHGARLVRELEAVEVTLGGGRVTQADMDVLAPILGCLVDDLEEEPEMVRPVGFIGELQMVTPFSSLKCKPLPGGITRGCIRSALAVANALMAARAEDKRHLARFVTWAEAATHHEDQRTALEEDVISIAECCGFSCREARRILRLAQELRFLRGAGKASLADAEERRVLDIFDTRGVVANPDTSFSQSELHVRPGVLLTGRFDRAARRARFRERRAAIKEAARTPSEARPL